MLWRKLFRTAWKYKAQFISMIIMVAIGVGVFVGFNMEWYSLRRDTAKFFDRTEFFDYRLVSEAGFSAEDAESVADIDGVNKVHRVLQVSADVKGESGKALSLWCEEGDDVGGFLTTGGDEYDGDREGFWLSDQYAKTNGYEIGDTLTVSYRGVEISAPIRGVGKSGEYMVCVSGDSQVMPDYSSFGFAFVSPKTIEAALGYVPYPMICFRSDLAKEEVEEKAEDVLGKTTLLLTKEETLAYSGAESEIEEGKTMGALLPAMFLLIGILTMITTMHRITANEKTQIGTLKALGFRNRRVLRHYTSYGFVIGLVGSALGVTLGFLIAAVVISPDGMMSTYFDMPYWTLYVPWFCWLIIAVAIGFLTLVSFLSVRRMLQGTAADALRPYAPKKMKSMAIERTKLWHKLSFATKWNLRDVWRHKARSLMTLFGILGCMILLVGGLGMRDTMVNFLDTIDNRIYHYETRVNLVETADNDETRRFAESIDGDMLASSSVQYDGDAIALEIYDVRHDRVRFLDESGKDISLGNDGVYICKRLADKGVTAGDTIEFSPYGSDETYRVRVAGVIRSFVTENIVMTAEFAEKEGIPYHINAIFTAEKPQDVPGASFISGMQSKQSVMDSYNSFMQIMNTMVVILVIAAVVLGIVVLYNLGVMSYVERTRELSTLKVVGFRNKRIGHILISQNIWLTVLGILIGLPAGVGVLNLLIATLAGEYELQATLGVLTYSVSILLTFGVSLIVGVFVARKNKKIDMVEALKGAE